MTETDISNIRPFSHVYASVPGVKPLIILLKKGNYDALLKRSLSVYDPFLRDFTFRIERTSINSEIITVYDVLGKELCKSTVNLTPTQRKKLYAVLRSVIIVESAKGIPECSAVAFFKSKSVNELQSLEIARAPGAVAGRGFFPACFYLAVLPKISGYLRLPEEIFLTIPPLPNEEPGIVTRYFIETLSIIANPNKNKFGDFLNGMLVVKLVPRRVEVELSGPLLDWFQRQVLTGNLVKKFPQISALVFRDIPADVALGSKNFCGTKWLTTGFVNALLRRVDYLARVEFNFVTECSIDAFNELNVFECCDEMRLLTIGLNTSVTCDVTWKIDIQGFGDLDMFPGGPVGFGRYSTLDRVDDNGNNVIEIVSVDCVVGDHKYFTAVITATNKN